jgi:hypothetical protein
MPKDERGCQKVYQLQSTKVFAITFRNFLQKRNKEGGSMEQQCIFTVQKNMLFAVIGKAFDRE